MDSDDERSQALCNVRSAPGRPLEVVVQLNEKSLSMEVDTGAAVSLVSETTYHNLFGDLPLTPSSVQLHTYSGEALPVLGETKVKVQYQDQVAQLQLIVVRGSGPSLFGRNWLSV